MTEDSTLLRGGLAVLPKVNLLPPEIEQGRRFRQIQVGMGAAVLASVGVVALLYVSASHQVTSAQGKLETSQATGQSLQAENAKYAQVTAIYARAAAAQSMLSQAMGDEVRFSQLLNDMSLSVPDNVWITSMSYSAAAAPAAAVPAGTTATSVGTLSVSGVALSHDDVAVWLESLAGQKTYANAYFSNAVESKIGARTVVNFSSTAAVTDKALSHRYDKAGS